MATHPSIAKALSDYNKALEDVPASIVSLAMENGGNNDISLDQCMMVARRKRATLEAESNLIQAYVSVEDSVASSTSKKTRAQRTCKNLRPYYVNNEGEFVFLTPTQTYWHLMCIKDPHCVTTVPKYIQKFRRRFRMPHSEFLVLLAECRTSGYFDRWLRTDAVGSAPSPLGLLLLGALRYLGRGLTFDDLEEQTAMGEETHRQFFHVFIRYGEEKMFPRFVRYPTTQTECEYHRHEFDVGGLTGAAFSSDGTHVLMWNCSAKLRQAHIGFKLSHPARAFNLTTNHRREILHSTDGSPARWNDKTLSNLDDFLRKLKNGEILQDVTFELMEWSGVVGNSAIKKVTYRGGWGLVDNGHHKWSCMQAPSKINALLSEQRLSDWIESFRKDSECVFGILKGRWRTLKTGVRLHLLHPNQAANHP